MKVIFLEDVPKVAKMGEIKEVANGYGRNFLISRKLALVATPESINTVKALIEKNARSQAQSGAEVVELANRLDGKEVVLAVRAGAKGRLYGSITGADIAAELEKSAGLVVDKRKIELDEPIRKVGSYEVVVKLGKDIVPKIKVTVNEKAA